MEPLQIIGLITIIVGLVIYKLYTLGIIGNAKSKKIGTLGEDRIAEMLSQIPNSKVYRNLYILRKSGKSTEIDLVLLTQHQIYVIESKNYNGMIFGTSGQQNWVVKYINGKTFKFYSPELQNQGHINALKNLIGLDDSLITSIIVFGYGSNISNVAGVKNCVTVDSLLSLIMSLESRGSGMIPPQYINALNMTFQSLENVNVKTKINHIKQVKQYNKR